MLFSSTIFLFLFLPITLIVNWSISSIRLKNIFLLIASLFFYAWGEGELVFLMLFSILMNYAFGIAIDKAASTNYKKIFLSLGIIGNLGILVYYKYAYFLIDNFNTLFSQTTIATIQFSEIALPIGISFFTFQSISYIVDVFRNEGKVQKDPLNLALYIALFPQLIAGPIVRYHDVFLQIENRTVDSDKIAEGIRRFIIGLAKKVLIANVCGRVADQIFDLSANDLTSSVAWLGIISYSFQIFFDFSGYSDMAIGLGKMFGFDFLENFNFPYISKSIKEFWRRWHISLSTWFRDYLYIPLGGNKKSLLRTYTNLIIVFFLTGLWHGASWNFIFWGLFHGLFLIIERLGLDKILTRLPQFIRHIYTLLVVIIGWVFFRSNDLASSFIYIQKMLGFSQPQYTVYQFSIFFEREVIITLIAAILVSIPLNNIIKNKFILSLKDSSAFFYLQHIMLVVIFLFSIMSIASGTHNPFIYFRF